MQEKKMAKPLRIAVVGLPHGCEHLDHYRQRPDVQVVGLCDRDESLLGQAGEKYQAPPAAWFTDYGQMLQAAKPDAVFVMTPPPLHAAMTIQALEAGCHVLVAKSLCRTLEEGEAMIRARNLAGRQVEVGLQQHYAPVYRYVQEHLRDADFGELRGAWIQKHYPSYWREPGNWQNRVETLGGTLLDCGIHEMDVILYLLNLPWTRVFVSGRQFLKGPPERNTPDAAVVLIDLAGGARITVDFLDSHAYCYVRTGIVGSEGKFEIEHWEPHGSGHVRFHANLSRPNPKRIYEPPLDASTGHIGIVEQSLYFLDVCRGTAASRSTLESALESLSLQMAIVKALRENRWVDRAEITARKTWRDNQGECSGVQGQSKKEFC
jgi:predicted dehydrogenase